MTTRLSILPPDVRRTGAPGTSRRTWVLVGLLAVLLAGMALTAASRTAWEAFVALACVASTVVAWIWHRGDVSMRHVLVFAVLFRLLFAWLPPVLSDDAFRYVWDGMLQAAGVNPFQYVPEAPELAAFRDGHVYSVLNSRAYYSVYPPVSQIVFAAGGVFYDHGWIASYYVVKLVFATLEVGAVLLLARLVDARSLLLYAWQPLVLVEGAGQAHTEAAMVFFLVLALWFARRGHGGGAAAAVASAGWVKLYPLVLLPFVWRRFGWRTVWPALVVTLVVWAPYARPDVPAHFAASLDLYVRYFEFNAGFYYAVKGAAAFLTGQDWSKVLGPVFRWVFVGMLPLVYARAERRRWSMEKAFLVTLGAFFICATTVHPWYLLAVLPLAAVVRPPAWHWFWLAAASTGTYLRYVDGPYWQWVEIGWMGWLLFALVRHGDDLACRAGPAADAWLQRLQRHRAKRKVDRIAAWLPGPQPVGARVLDLGAGEGYVGAEIGARTGAGVVLADVVDFNRTEFPLVTYDGARLPFGDGAFDTTVLYFVLHHCEDQEAVFREAMRVTRSRVVVVESTYVHAWDRRLLTVLDRLANRLRSGGRMRPQEAHLHFRTVPEWRAFFREAGAHIEAERRVGRLVHRQAFFSLTRAEEG